MTWETVITFLAGVGAVVVGQLLGGWIQRGADERRWARQELDRRRARAEEAAEEIMDRVYAMVDACHEVAKVEGYRGDAYPPQEILEADYDAVLRVAMRIPDAPVKEAAEKASSALFYYQPGQMNWDVWRVTSTVTKELRAVISAYLAGQAVPPTPGIDEADAEVNAFEDYLEHRRKQDEEAGRRRAAAESGEH